MITVWGDRVEEHQKHALLKSATNAISFYQVAQVVVRRGKVWSDVIVESTGGHTIKIEGLNKNEAASLKALIDRAIHDLRAGHAPAPVALQLSVADELTKLVELRDTGVLSQAEFEAQRARLLS